MIKVDKYINSENSDCYRIFDTLPCLLSFKCPESS